MKTELEDVIHFYLGCKGFAGTRECELLGLSEYEGLAELKFSNGNIDWWNTYNFKPILRPLSDMTEEEFNNNMSIPIDGNGHDEYHFIKDPKINIDDRQFSNREIIWLLKNGFDLFGLIESSQAIDKNKL